jgi:uncharacterized membrane protein
MKSNTADTLTDQNLYPGVAAAVGIIFSYAGPTAVLMAMGFMSGFGGPLLAIMGGWYMAGTLEQRLMEKEARGL